MLPEKGNRNRIKNWATGFWGTRNLNPAWLPAINDAYRIDQ
jgi:Ser/Thr protein kinase RdoA (MazF antagonist)